MEKEKGTVFVDPCAVTPRQLSQGEMECLAGGATPLTIVVLYGTAVAFIY